MMKFLDDLDIVATPRKKWHRPARPVERWHESSVPTVDEVDEFNATSYRSMITQILAGQAVSYSFYDVEADIDNEIPIISTDFLDKQRKLNRERNRRLYKPKKVARVKTPVLTRAQKKFAGLLVITGKYSLEAARELARSQV